MRILLAYPYYGELGWEIFQWRPRVRFVDATHAPFDRRIVSVRRGREGLYTGMSVDEIQTFSEHEDCTEGNAFVLHRPDAYRTYKAHRERFDNWSRQLSAEGHDVVTVQLPPTQYRYYRFKMRQRLFEQLLPEADRIIYWRDKIRPGAVIFHLRWLARSTKKNTPEHLYHSVAAWANAAGRQFVTVGKRNASIPFRPEGLMLMDQTSLSDLIAIYHLGAMVVGSSSGPMHLAAATGTPHVVWGGGRKDIRTRYVDEWNPLKTPVEFVDPRFHTKPAKLLDALDRMSAHPAVTSRDAAPVILQSERSQCL